MCRHGVRTCTRPFPLSLAMWSYTSTAVRVFAGPRDWRLHQVDVNVEFGADGGIIRHVQPAAILNPSTPEGCCRERIAARRSDC